MPAGLQLLLEIDDKGTPKVSKFENRWNTMKKRVIGGTNAMARSWDRAKQRWGSFQSKIARGAQLLKIALAALAVTAVITGAKFEQSMANTGAILGKTRQEMTKLTAVARGLGATTVFSASQAAEAMYSLASAGQTMNQIISSSPAVLLFAGAAATDLGSAAETLVQTLAQFSLAAEESNRVVNVFAASISASLLNAGRLREGLSQVGSTAAALGIELEQTVAILGALNNAGQVGGMAGTRLKNVLVRLAAPNAVLRDLMGDVTLKTHGFAAAMAALADADPGAIFKAFGRIAAPAVLALRKQTEALKALQKQITGTNKAQEMFNIQMDTVMSQFKIFKSQIQENMIATFYAMRDAGFDVMQSLTKLLADIKPYLVGIVSKTVEWFRENKELVKTLGKVGIALGVVVGLITVLTSGIGLIAVALVAGALLWSKYGDQITDNMTRGYKAVSDFALGFYESHKTAIDGLIAKWRTMFNRVAGFFVFIGMMSAESGKLFYKNLSGPIGWLWDKLSWYGGKLKEFYKMIGRTVEGVWDTTTGYVNTVIEKELAMLGAEGTKVGEIWNKAFGVDYAGAYLGAIGAGADATTKKLGELRDRIIGIGAELKAAGEAAGGRIQGPEAPLTPKQKASNEVLQQKIAQIREVTEFEIQQGFAVDQAKQASLLRTIAFGRTHTEYWLDARLALIEANYQAEKDKANGNAELIAQAQIAKSAESAAARMEHEDAVLQHWIETHEAELEMLDTYLESYSAGHDTVFDTILSRSASTQAGIIDMEMTGKQRRETIWKAMKMSFFKNTSDMVKHFVGSWIKGLLLKEKMELAAAVKTRFLAAKQGAVNAFNAFAAIPIIGPILGAAAAAAAFAFLMAFHKGGLIGEGARREFPVLVEGGEYMTQRRSVTPATRPVLEYINKTGQVPATGGGDVYEIEVNVDASGGAPDLGTIIDEIEEQLAPALEDLNERNRFTIKTRGAA